jgi:hypothetical protein
METQKISRLPVLAGKTCTVTTAATMMAALIMTK